MVDIAVEQFFGGNAMTSKTILVIDDEQDILFMLDKGLTLQGYRVLTADNGADGLKLAQQEQPDTIILDVAMPEMDGPEVATHLRENARTREIPIVFLTALISKEEEAHYRHFVANNITLAKPFDTEELAELIESTILA